jgi:DNA invertase Pin-like site-specific DNA recombinase
MVITYLRNSDLKQKNSTFVQLEQVENYCNQNNLKLGEVFIDKGLSGTKSDRTKYQEVLDLVKTGEVDTLIVLSLSRLSQVMSSIYELEVNMIRERTSDVLQSKKDNQKVYSKVPYGFTRKGTDLIIDKKEKKMLDKMYRLKDKGNSYQDISNFLNRNKYKTKSGGVFNRNLVFNIMKTERVFN